MLNPMISDSSNPENGKFKRFLIFNIFCQVVNQRILGVVHIQDENSGRFYFSWRYTFFDCFQIAFQIRHWQIGELWGLHGHDTIENLKTDKNAIEKKAQF